MAIAEGGKRKTRDEGFVNELQDVGSYIKNKLNRDIEMLRRTQCVFLICEGKCTFVASCLFCFLDRGVIEDFIHRFGVLRMLEIQIFCTIYLKFILVELPAIVPLSDRTL